MRRLRRTGCAGVPFSALLGVFFLAGSGCQVEETAAGLAPKESEARPGDPEPLGPFPYHRCVVIGASASAGFGLPLLGERRPHLGDFLAAAQAGEPSEWSCHASEYFFLQPEGWGRRQLDAALAEEPELVVALDYLFWFGYGLSPSTEARRKRFAKGLALLEELPCTVVVSELPDMSVAIGTMLAAEQVPSPEALAVLNADLADWARSHEEVIVAPMAEYVATLLAGRPVEVGEHRYPEGSDRFLLQEDHLHPTLGGLAALATLVAESLVEARSEVKEQHFTWEPAELVPVVRARAAAAASIPESGR